MKKEDFFEALGEMDPGIVQEAQEFHGRSRKPVWMRWVAGAACVAVIFSTVLVPKVLKGSGQMPGSSEKGGGQSPVKYAAMKTVLAKYPEPTAKSMSAEKFADSDERWKWWNSYVDQVLASRELQANMQGYYASIMRQLLGDPDQNTVCSPLNTYIAFAMLAEVSAGNTRQQILDMLGVSDVEQLRANTATLWRANYVDTPVLKSSLANSLWLNQQVEYHEDVLEGLAENYFTSSFRGTPGSEEMDQALRKWTDDNTGGLLADYTREMGLDEEAVLEILSTIYYKAIWDEEFAEKSTTSETFHGLLGNQKVDSTVDMMHCHRTMGVYSGEHFTALGLELRDSGSMYFILPDEGTDVNTLATDSAALADMLSMPLCTMEEGWFFPMVHLSVPKFKVSGKTDLRGALQALGVTDALDYTTADFSPLTSDVDYLYLSKADHAAMVEIDEHGVVGTAYTELALKAGGGLAKKTIDFVLDRPFLYMVTGSDGSVLFAGVVRSIEG